MNGAIMSRKTNSMAVLVILAIGLSGCSTLYQATSGGDMGRVRSHIDEGAFVDERGAGGKTPLMAAAETNNAKIMRLLIMNGADVNLKDDAGKSALWYAFEKDSFNAFKILLEKGAKLDFTFPKGKGLNRNKRKIMALAGEYREYKRIKNQRYTGDLGAFDSYLSKYGNGAYRSDVMKILRQIVQNEYKRTEQINSPDSYRRFVNRYSGLGGNCYVVTASVLNIRANAAIDSKTVGSYKKGETVCADAEKYGWLKTNGGWISKTYVKPSKHRIPVIEPYISRASARLNMITGEKRSAVKKRYPGKRVKPAQKPVAQAETKVPEERGEEKAAPAKPEPKPKPVDTKQETPILTLESDPPAAQATPEEVSYDEDPLAQAQRELDEILKDASKAKLKAFIRKYKDSAEHDAIVKQARKAYMRISLTDR